MPSLEGAVARAFDFFDNNGFRDRLAELVAIPSTSQDPGHETDVQHYLDGAIRPWLERMGFIVAIHPNPRPGFGPILVAVGLYRARLAHRWPAILLAIGTVPLFVAPSGGVLATLLHLPICVAIAGLGLELWHLNAANSQDSPAPRSREAHPAQT